MSYTYESIFILLRHKHKQELAKCVVVHLETHYLIEILFSLSRARARIFSYNWQNQFSMTLSFAFTYSYFVH